MKFTEQYILEEIRASLAFVKDIFLKRTHSSNDCFLYHMEPYSLIDPFDGGMANSSRLVSTRGSRPLCSE